MTAGGGVARRLPTSMIEQSGYLHGSKGRDQLIRSLSVPDSWTMRVGQSPWQLGADGPRNPYLKPASARLPTRVLPCRHVWDRSRGCISPGGC
jgi:hypothetical protein